MIETQFKLSDRFFSDLRRMTLTRGVPVAVTAVVVGVFVAARAAHVEAPVISLIAACLFALVGFGGWRGYQRQVASLQEFRINLGNDQIRRSQPDLPAMTIPKDRITRIVRIPGRSLTVYGHGRQQFIEIPESLAGFATVESTLRGWHSFEERPAALAAWFPMSAGLGTIALYAVALLATNRVLATAAGVFLIAMLASSEVALWRNRHADPRMRRLSWLLPPCILVVAVQVWLAWAR